MKTIEEAAKESAEKLIIYTSKYDYKKGFIEGAKFAQKWTPIEKESPPEDVAVIFKFTKNNEGVIYRLGHFMLETILLIGGASLDIEMAKFYGIQWKLVEIK